MSFQTIDDLLEQLTHCGIPACELVVTHKGDLVYRGSAGYSDADKTKKVTNNDLYWIFSATKPITCVAAMRLVERGLIGLNDPVSKYIPAFSELTVRQKDGSLAPAQNTMTVEHLFTMCGGMDYNMETPAIKEVQTNPDATTFELVSAMAKTPLMFEPGTNYRYSLCHDVLAAIVEVVSGKTFGEYLRTNIFEPLEMDDIGFRPSEEQQKRISQQYRAKVFAGAAEVTPTANRFRLSNRYESGGAGLFTKPDTYIKFLNALSLGGTAKNGYCLLKEDTVKLLQENRLCDDAWKSFSTTRLYGYGWGLCGRVHINPVYSMSRSAAGEFGWDGAAGAFALADPNKQVALYFATHVLGHNYVYHHVHPMLRDLAYEAIETI